MTTAPAYMAFTLNNRTYIAQRTDSEEFLMVGPHSYNILDADTGIDIGILWQSCNKGWVGFQTGEQIAAYCDEPREAFTTAVVSIETRRVAISRNVSEATV